MKKIFSFFAAILLAGSMMADNIYSIDFKAGQGEWEIDNVELGGLEKVWAQDSRYGMKASAYVDNASHATESWLISPAFDLSGFASAKLFISHALNKGSKAAAAVKAFDGEDWVDVELSAWPAGTDWNFIDAEADLAAVAGKANVRIAFVYKSSADDCPTWEIASVAVTDGGEIVPPEYEVISVAKALQIGEALELKGETTDKYIVEGYITNIVEDGVETYKNMTFWMADAPGTAASNAEGAFEVFRGRTEVSFAVGTKVEVLCTIKKFAKDETYVIETGNGAVVSLADESGVENIVLTEKAQKVMVDGVVYVVRDNKLFNVQGTQIR